VLSQHKQLNVTLGDELYTLHTHPHHGLAAAALLLEEGLQCLGFVWPEVGSWG
jgi:hypothetical protein